MPTSPGWYVAICCFPTLFVSVCSIVSAFLPVRATRAILSAVPPTLRISNLGLFGYAIRHFGIFTGLGIVVVSLACIFTINHSIGRGFERLTDRRIARNRQALIQAIVDKAGLAEIEAESAAEELESLDDATLREVCAEVLQSDDPGHALLAEIVSLHLDELGYEPDEYSAVLVTSDLRQLSNLREWLLTDVGILTEDAKHISIRLRNPLKTRRTRGPKATVAGQLLKLRSEPPIGDPATANGAAAKRRGADRRA